MEVPHQSPKRYKMITWHIFFSLHYIMRQRLYLQAGLEGGHVFRRDSASLNLRREVKGPRPVGLQLASHMRCGKHRLGIITKVASFCNLINFTIHWCFMPQCCFLTTNNKIIKIKKHPFNIFRGRKKWANWQVQS